MSKTVIEMAKKAGFVNLADAYWDCTTKGIECFAELVRADAIADEREACAQVCEEYDDEYDVHTKQTKEGITTAIRARENI